MFFFFGFEGKLAISSVSGVTFRLPFFFLKLKDGIKYVPHLHNAFPMLRKSPLSLSLVSKTNTLTRRVATVENKGTFLRQIAPNGKCILFSWLIFFFMQASAHHRG